MCDRVNFAENGRPLCQVLTAAMSGFDDREKSFEAKYKRDQETLFRITSRRNRLLGL